MGRSRDHANTNQICWISWKYRFQANKLQNGHLKQVPLHLGTTQCQGTCLGELNMDSLHQLGRVVLCRHHGSFRWRAFGVGGITEKRRLSRLTVWLFWDKEEKQPHLSEPFPELSPQARAAQQQRTVGQLNWRHRRKAEHWFQLLPTWKCDPGGWSFLEWFYLSFSH